MNSNPLSLSPAERLILEALGDRPWTRRSYSKAAVAEATCAWNDVRRAVGYSSPGGWITDQDRNPKLGKSGLPTSGVTLHAAKGGEDAWKSLDQTEHRALAMALGTDIDRIEDALRFTVCPFSTAACRAGCVTAKSAYAIMPVSQRTRLARTLFTLVRPTDAVTLLAKELDRLGSKHGRRGARWRVNISDDIRWELLAPGLFEFGVRPYTYTKWSPEQRPESHGMRIVYSATEHHTDAELVRRCNNGHRVCVVFDVPKNRPLPATWHGVRVVNGDKTDDLWAHPAGSIVGLRVKGPTLEAKQAMRDNGFARPAVPPTLVTLQPIEALAA